MKEPVKECVYKTKIYEGEKLYLGGKREHACGCDTDGEEHRGEGCGKWESKREDKALSEDTNKNKKLREREG